MKEYKLILLVSLLSIFRLASATLPDFETISHKSSDTLILKTGVYTHASFKSESRGNVDFNVYLPPTWSKDSSTEYPLIILLHGQNGSEYSFVDALPADSLNHWVKTGAIPEMVVIALRGGENTRDMQWYSDENVNMITSEAEDELRKYCNEKFNSTMDSSKISIIGHSRGAAGALNFAVNYPNKFSSIVSLSYVSDYTIEGLKESVTKNRESIINSSIGIQMYIGNEDRFVLEADRRGSWIINSYLKENGIINKLITIEDTSHDLSELFEYPNGLNYFAFCSKMWKKVKE
ncbi:alpha/beta hydrolase [Flagellimonas sp.]|uniref:alpha/beta hydrolase n=1 Tax=Flagellimonas sp. TaxID=2058762 RepID=UPI003BAADEDF